VPLVAAYHRPTSINEALSLLAEPNRIPLAGGTVINADRAASKLEVVDLQALGLSEIVAEGDQVRIGATATLAAITGSDDIPDWLRAIAKAEAPSTLRTLATIGGAIVVGSGDSVLLAALLVSDAEVDITGVGAQPLAAVLAEGVAAGSLVTSVTITTEGQGAIAATGRTPADVPIVAAVAHSSGSLALTGVAPTPVLVDASDPTSSLDPPSDFRGSAAYRMELARVLSARAEEAAR
jgi:carbon-monoxide dehydrogenase medium subunit